MLRMENILDRREADILVHPAIAADIVGVQQRLVVGSSGQGGGRTGCHGGVRGERTAERVNRRGGVRHVVDKGVAGANRVDAGCNRVEQVAFAQACNPGGGLLDHLRQPTRAENEVAVSVRGQQRHVTHIAVGEPDAKELRGVGLQLAPCRHAVEAVDSEVAQQGAGGVQFAIGADHVSAEERLVGRVGGIGLALIDERRVAVGEGVDVVGGAEDSVRAGLVLGAGQDHEVGLCAGHEQRVIRLQRYEDEAGAAKRVRGDLVKAVVEELAKEREETVGRRREAVVRRDVGDEEALGQAKAGLAAGGGLHRGREVALRDVDSAVQPGDGGAGIVGGAVNAVSTGQREVLIARAEEAEGFLLGRERGGVAVHEDVVRGAENAVHARRQDLLGGGHGQRVVGVLAGDQQADRARLRIDDQATGLGISSSGLRVLQYRGGQGREHLARRAKVALAGQPVVVRAGDFAQAE